MPLLHTRPFTYKRALLIALSVAALAAIASALVVIFKPGGSNVSGLGAAQDVPAEFQGYCATLMSGENPHVGQRRREALLALAASEADADVVWRVDYALRLATEQLKFGQANEAVRLLDNALEIEEANGADPERLDEILDALVVAHIRQGENDNCTTPDGRFTCLLPLDGGAQSAPAGFESAIEHLSRLLERRPGDVRYRWLLNVAYMALGRYPDDVPVEHLIPPSVFEDEAELGRFDEIAPEAGVYNVKLAGGAIVDDFDNDGLLDIVTTTWDPCGSMAYYRNDGNGRFSDMTTLSGLEEQLGGLNAVQADYDNDGWMDILVLRGGWMLEDGRIRMSLLRNNGNNTFTDVTHAAGIASPAYPRMSAAWADFDLDGHLDLFVCNESQPITWRGDPEQGRYPTIFPSQLFKNNGDGTFTDIAVEARVTNDRYCKGSAWGDYDNDGDPDLYVSNYEAENRLYRNNGDGTFTDIAYPLGVVEPVDSFVTWFWDYNNDGCLDLFVAGYSVNIAEVAADYMGLSNDGATPRLYANDCAGGFADATVEAGLDRVHMTMGANYGDFDNDGYPDILLGTGFVSYDSLEPNVALKNDGAGRFQTVTFSSGLGHLQKGHGVAFGDLDRDGDQDVFMQVGGFYPGDSFLSALYENPGNGSRWLSIKLVGTDSNTAAIGARIRVTVRDAQGERHIHALVGSGGSFGASSIEQEIGLGSADRVVALRIHWPSGYVQEIRDVPLDSRVRVVEGRGTFRVLDSTSFRLAPDRDAIRP